MNASARAWSVSLSRNLGASFGIAFVTTMLARRTQFHQERLVSHATPYDWQWVTTTQRIANTLHTAGLGMSDAAARAQAQLYAMVSRQAGMLAYIDNFWLLGVLFLLPVPLVLLMRNVKPAKGGMGH